MDDESLSKTATVRDAARLGRPNEVGAHRHGILARIATAELRGYRLSSQRDFAQLMGAGLAVIRLTVQRIGGRVLGEAPGAGAIAATWRAPAKRF